MHRDLTSMRLADNKNVLMSPLRAHSHLSFYFLNKCRAAQAQENRRIPGGPRTSVWFRISNSVIVLRVKGGSIGTNTPNAHDFTLNFTTFCTDFFHRALYDGQYKTG